MGGQCMTALDELIAAVEAGKDVPLGRAADAMNVPADLARSWGGIDRANRGSLGAAKALHDALLPGWDWSVTVDQAIVSNSTGLSEFSRITDNPARAWLLCVLRILRAVKAQQEGGK
jgi:hypothetical protein